MINRGGAHIYPAEVERVLAGPRGGLGRPRRTAANVQALFAALDGLCRQKLSSYKVPARWFVIDDFPRNAMNKVLEDRLPCLTGQEIRPAQTFGLRVNPAGSPCAP